MQRRLNRRSGLIKLVSMALTTMFLPLGAWAQETPKVRIGAILPLSGSQKVYGEEAMRGIRIAYEMLQKEEADLAKHISILTGDDKSQSQEATRLGKEFFGKKRIHVIIGSISASATNALAEVAENSNGILVSPITTPTSDVNDDRIFSIGLSQHDQSRILANYAAERLKAKRAAILIADLEGQKEMAARFVEHFTKAGGKIVKEETYPLGTNHFKDYLERIKQANAQVIFLPAFAHSAAAVMKGAQALKIDAKMLGTDGWDSPSLRELAKEAGRGHLFVTHYDVGIPTKRNQAFVKAFQSKYHREPGSIAALAFDSFNLIVDAVKRAGTTLPKPLHRAFLRTKDLEGVTGTLSYSKASGLQKSGVIKSVSTNTYLFEEVVGHRDRTPPKHASR